MTHGEGMGKHMGPMGMHGMGGMMGGMHGPMGMCPMCGMGFMMGRHAHGMGPGSIVKIAKRKLIIEKVEAKLEERYGDELDKMADEIIEFAMERQRMKAEHMERAMKMRRRVWEIFAEGPTEEGEEAEEED